jgi:hypothetical protein
MSRLALFLLLSSFLTWIFPALPPASYASTNSPSGTLWPSRVTYDYRIELDHGCVGYIRVVLRSENATAIAWVLIPRISTGFETNGSVVEVKSVLQGSSTTSLYRNVSLLLTPGAPVGLSYSFPNVCLVLRGRAVFLSPLLRFPSGATGSISVRVKWPGASLTDVDGTPSSVKPLPDGFVVERALPLASERLSFTFSVPEEELMEVTNGSLTFVLPHRYKWVAERLSVFYAGYKGNLSELFPKAPERVRVTFFLPTRYDEGPEGYVSFEGGNEGSVSLNLYLLRMVDGMLEVTFTHELIHRYLFANGVGAGATWFHEGLATYLSVKMAGVAGLEAASYLRSMFGRFGISTSDLRELLIWRPGESRGNRWYAMAYLVFERLFETDEAGTVMALRSLGNTPLTTPQDASKHLFNHLNHKGRSFLVESGLAAEGSEMLSQGIVTETVAQTDGNSNYADGRKIDNATQFNDLLVNVLVIALAIVVVAIILIDFRRI